MKATQAGRGTQQKKAQESAPPLPMRKCCQCGKAMLGPYGWVNRDEGVCSRQCNEEYSNGRA